MGEGSIPGVVWCSPSPGSIPGEGIMGDEGITIAGIHE
jgi:hypothetical protein